MPPSLVGAASGDSLLSSYLIIIGTIMATVLVVTLHTVVYMQNDFGSWESTSASTIQLQPPKQLPVPNVVVSTTKPNISVSSIIARTQKEPEISVSVIIASIDRDKTNEENQIYEETSFPTEDPVIVSARKPSANLRRERYRQ